ncbi:MAG TPA: hypothetical protein VGH20_16460 [Myxococcales bacterium]
MTARGALFLVAVAMACEPSVRGRCASSADCRTGSACALEGICVASSGTCSPACAAGEACDEGACVLLRPTVTVTLDAGTFLSAHDPAVRVRVDASPLFGLGALQVAANTDHTVASGSAGADAGDQTVTLTNFENNVSSAVNVRATLSFSQDGGSAQTVTSAPVAAFVDDVPPEIEVSGEGIDGSVGRTGGPLQIRAAVNDGQQGSGTATATLVFNPCPPRNACSYDGTGGGADGGVVSYLFQVPRTVQNVGATTPLPASVTSVDRAGNTGTAQISVQINGTPGAALAPLAPEEE